MTWNSVSKINAFLDSISLYAFSMVGNFQSGMLKQPT